MSAHKFARTLDEAFPFGAEYGCAITHTGGGAATVGRIVGAALAVLLLLALVACVWSWTQAAPVQSIALADATAQAQRQARFERAARSMCAGRVAWVDTARGVVQCGKAVAP